MNRLEGKRARSPGDRRHRSRDARRFLAEGAGLAVTGTSPAGLEAARAELGDVVRRPSDAGDVAGRRRIADAVRRAFGGLDVLFVNAGVSAFRPLEGWDEAGFDRSVAVNLKGPFFLVQALLPPSPTPPQSSSTPRSTPTSACRARASTRRPRPGCSRSPGRSRASSCPAASRQRDESRPDRDPAPRQDRHGRGGHRGPGGAESGRAARRARRDRQGGRVPASDEAAFTVGSELVIDGGMSTL